MGELRFVKFVRHGDLPVEKIAEIFRSSPNVDTVLSELIKVASRPEIVEELRAVLTQKNAEIKNEINSARFHLGLEPLYWEGQSPESTPEPNI
jgi:hypothetical protein